MKRLTAAFFVVFFAAATMYALEFLLLRHHPPLLLIKLKLSFWLNLAFCAAVVLGAWGIAAWRKPRGDAGKRASKKEAELEEKFAYLSRIYQDLSNSLRLEKQKVESIIGCAPDGIFTFGRDGVIASWNRSMEALTGMNMQYVVGKHYADSLSFFSGNGQQLVDPFAPCLMHGTHVSLLDCRIETPGGKNIPVALGAAPVQPGKKGIEQVIVTVKDIRTQKEAEKLKEDMMAVITHDLRSPLSAILGYAGLIQNPKLCRGDADRHKYVEALIRSGKGMLLLINNLLQSAGVEEGRMAVSKEPVSLKPVLQESVENLEVLARGKDLSLWVEAPDGVMAITDREKLQEILVNLITNAIKFSRPGESVRVKASEEEERVKIAVEDGGPGISEEEKTRLFEKFSTVRKQGSTTGLGLYIVKKLVSALGGDIMVESMTGKGSTFIVALPAYRKPADPDPARQLSLLSRTEETGVGIREEKVLKGVGK